MPPSEVLGHFPKPGLRANSWHRILGIILLLPLCLWSLTGLVFLIKPGYTGAYATLTPRFLPITQSFTITPAEDWSEVKLYRTLLGDHLIVKIHDTWRHLDPSNMRDRPLPSQHELAQLVDDAMAQWRERYGNIAAVQGDRIFTDTGVEINVDWSQLTFTQTGSDTRVINTLYKIHYLQWLGTPTLNAILGAAGAFSVIVLALLGLVNYLKTRKTRASL